MADSSGLDKPLNDSPTMRLTGKIMVLAVLLLFLVVIFVLFLHLYAKWYWYHREEQQSSAATTTRRRRRFDFAPGHLESASVTGHRRGLDPSLLKSLPLLIFNPKDFKDGLECAVCLSELAGGEKARLLPKCNHGFHLDCIDMWFQSHSTCPICRNPVSTQPDSITCESGLVHSPRTENSNSSSNVVVDLYSSESPNFPTNVLFWGNQTQVSTLGSYLDEELQLQSQHNCPSSSSSSSPSSSDGMLVIDIPYQISEEEEAKSPVPTRLRSLKRLLSRDSRRVNIQSGVDAEQIS